MITLLTDFGTADHFAGVLKGVIATLAPQAPVVDLSHAVPPYEIPTAAFLLEQSWRYFPPGSIHVAIVDPGVGSARRPLLIAAARHYFIGPDNGIFSFVLQQPGAEARVLDKPRYWLPNPSHTFHGRDIFAPVAAHLANGTSPATLGTRIDDALCSPALAPVRISRRTFTGLVLHQDHFGNLITNFSQQQFPSLPNRPFTLTAGLETIEIYASTYAHCPPGELAVLPGSSGFYEIALAQASAAQRLGLRTGSPLELTVA
ncbi:MAG: SAM-dependent chlorinase/fluorinase [Bryobacter sp.]|nr:SAM-dependent chlorinase/fluorinase [Bryobacter sp.]